MKHPGRIKIHITFLIIFITLLLITQAAADQPSVIVTGTDVSPAVLMPGEKGLVTFTIKNTATTATITETTGKTAVTDGTTVSTEIYPTIKSVYLDGKKEIKVLGGNSQFSGDIGPGQEIKLTFLIEAPAVKGIYFPVLIIGVLNAENLRYPVPVNVNMPVSAMKKPVISLERTNQGYAVPGDNFTVDFSITNTGKSTAGDLTLRIEPDNPSVAASGKSVFYAGDMKEGESYAFSVPLQTDKNADTGIYDLPVRISYSDPDGNYVTITGTTGIDFRGKAGLSIASMKTDPVLVSEGDEFEVLIRIENTGTGEAKSTYAGLDLPFEGTKGAFVGKIKPNNDAPAVFTYIAGKSGDYLYNLTVEYEDDTGAYSETYTLSLNVRKNDGWIAIVVILTVLAVAGFVFYRHYARKK
ncbi:COG1361 S-layer family protein [Methanoplanus limicola]|uniref:S-layer-like domain-containing protein n=1 Tax=Methanoplanus limicola DSM 2279 TaxID=937775 RepID=H1YYD9_9EURY|nr:COG1361 S-layer family protein [Methanoplanus limicola]EHQ35037.1 S-layer-like domain-containing protein [Methanoplanus limicola DSM 2279]